METTTEHYKKLNNIFGKKYVKGKIESPYDFIHIASKGLNANIIKNFRLYFNIPLQATAQMLSVSEPTIYRWTRTNKIYH